MKPGLKLFDALEIDHGGAMNAQKFVGVEAGFEIIHGVAKQMHVAADVEAKIIAGSLDPVDLLSPEEKDTPTGFDHQTLQRVPSATADLDFIEKSSKLFARSGGTFFSDLL